MGSTVAQTLILAGSLVFLTGAAIGVPSVFTQPDSAARLRLLDRHRTRWRAAQPLYALGPVVAAAGVGWAALEAGDSGVVAWLAIAGALLLVGSLCWSWSVWLRFRYVREFALGELPGWSFTAYVWLTLAGLAALGAGLLESTAPAWAGWLTLAATGVYLAWWLRVRDLPPFAFYVLLIVVSPSSGL